MLLRFFNSLLKCYLPSTDIEKTDITCTSPNQDVLWIPTNALTPRRVAATDWSALKKQDSEWVVPKFSGGPATARDPRLFSATCSIPTSCGISEDLPFRCYTPRQQKLFHSIHLPRELVDEASRPSPCFAGVYCAHERRALLRETFRNFVVELARGAYLTHLDIGRHYVPIHCQLLESLDALTVDVNNGRRIEFPLAELGSVYVLVKDCQPSSTESDDDTTQRCDGGRTAGEPPSTTCASSLLPAPSLRTSSAAPEAELIMPPDVPSPSSRSPANIVPRLNLSRAIRAPRDYLVVVPFRFRKIAFVFRDAVEADRFKVCLEVLARYVALKTSTANICMAPSLYRSDSSPRDAIQLSGTTKRASSSSCGERYHAASPSSSRTTEGPPSLKTTPATAPPCSFLRRHSPPVSAETSDEDLTSSSSLTNDDDAFSLTTESIANDDPQLSDALSAALSQMHRELTEDP